MKKSRVLLSLITVVLSSQSHAALNYNSVFESTSINRIQQNDNRQVLTPFLSRVWSDNIESKGESLISNIGVNYSYLVQENIILGSNIIYSYNYDKEDENTLKGLNDLEFYGKGHVSVNQSSRLLWKTKLYLSLEDNKYSYSSNHDKVDRNAFSGGHSIEPEVGFADKNRMGELYFLTSYVINQDKKTKFKAIDRSHEDSLTQTGGNILKLTVGHDFSMNQNKLGLAASFYNVEGGTNKFSIQSPSKIDGTELVKLSGYYLFSANDQLDIIPSLEYYRPTKDNESNTELYQLQVAFSARY